MDIIRDEVLREMVRDGRAYQHEVKSVADELLRRRGDNPDFNFDGMIIRVPKTVLLGGYKTYSGAEFSKLPPGQSMLIEFSRISGESLYAIITRMPRP